MLKLSELMITSIKFETIYNKDSMEKYSYMQWKNEMFNVESIIDETLWNKQLIENFQKKLDQIFNEINKISNLIKGYKKISVSISFAGDQKIIKLNHLYRQKNLPTNVLSFPSHTQRNNGIFLGDIIFAAETIFREVKKEKKSLNDHLIHLFIHSFLHLLGYDHETEDKAKTMERLEIKMLETLKIDNPYE